MVSFTHSGVANIHSPSLDLHTAQVTSHESFGANQTMAILVRVAPIAYVMINRFLILKLLFLNRFLNLIPKHNNLDAINFSVRLSCSLPPPSAPFLWASVSIFQHLIMTGNLVTYVPNPPLSGSTPRRNDRRTLAVNSHSGKSQQQQPTYPRC